MISRGFSRDQVRKHVVVDRALIDVSSLGTLSRAIRVNLASNLIQRAPRMKAATFVSNSTLQRNIQPLLQSVCHVISCVPFAAKNVLISRSFRHKTLPSERLIIGRDLCQHFEERLATFFWHFAYPSDYQMFAHLS